MIRKVLILSALVSVLSACDSDTKIISTPILQDKPVFVPPAIPPADQKPVNWIVITKENAVQKLTELEKNGIKSVFAITPRGYENLSINEAELRRYIQQQNAIIISVRQYYETPMEQNNGKK